MRLKLFARAHFVALLVGGQLAAAEVRVAVASNFVAPMETLAQEFTAATGHRVLVTTGATGKLYAQIENGAPFDVLLAADQEAPARLQADGFGVSGTRFTYAIGKLVLYSAQANYVDAQGAILRHGSFEHLAIANPKLAPYGSAAICVLAQLHLLESLRPKLVEGENIAQTLSFVVSGSAEVGFVALSQILVGATFRPGSYWIVPESLYPPLKQDALELREGTNNPAAPAFLAFLKSPRARAIIAAHGYGLSSPEPTDLHRGPSAAGARP
jgi:molybdate transport system substrate-binding protein